MARRRSRNVRFNPVTTDRIRLELQRLKRKVQQIENVTFDPKIFEFFDRHKTIHYEEMLFERLLLGYTIMRGRCSKKVTVKLDDISEQLLKREMRFRNSIKRGSEFAEVLMILRENDGSMKLFELKERMLQFGKDWTQSTALISQLIGMKAIKIRNDVVELSSMLRPKRSKVWKQHTSPSR